MTTDPIVFKITDYIERDLEWEEEESRKLGLRFEHFQLKEAPAAEIVRQVGDADIVLVNMARFTREVVAGLARAKVIIRHGIGYDNVDVPAATEHGIILANESTASSEDVAEHAILLMLSAYKKKNIQDRILGTGSRRASGARSGSSPCTACTARRSGSSVAGTSAAG